MNRPLESTREIRESGVKWINEIPIEWKLARIKDVSFCLDGKRIPISAEMRRSGSIPYWGAGNIVDYIDKYIFNEELVLLGEDGAPFFDKNRPVAFYINSPIWVNNHIHVLKNKENIEAKYLTYCLNCVDYYPFVGGSIIPKLTQSSMKKINIPLPPLHEQQAISNYLDEQVGKIDELISEQKQSIEKWKEYKQSLITETVTKGLNPNVEMKDSGVEWIGEIPSDWETKKIRHLSKVLRGASPRPIDNPIYFDENGRYSWVRIADVSKSGMFLTEAGQKLSELGANKSVKLSTNNLFISICATVGKPCITGIECCIHDGFVYFPQMDKDLNKFLYYIFKSGECYKGLGNWGTQLNLNTTIIGNISIPFPKKVIIKEIADFLDDKCSRIDQTIEQKQTLIKQLEEYKQSLIYECVTGKRWVR